MMNLQFFKSKNLLGDNNSNNREIKNLTEQCGNRELVEFLYNCRKDGSKIKWISHDELFNIEPLAEGGFGIIYIANWYNKYHHKKVALKCIYTSQNVIPLILKEVNKLLNLLSNLINC